MDPAALEAVVRSAIAVLALMCVVGVVGIARRDNSIVDMFWGVAFVVAAVAAISTVDQEDRGQQAWLVLLLVVVWAARLSVHIALRRRNHHGEDWRYAAWRKQWGVRRAWLRSVLQIYLLQGVLALCCSAAVFAVVLSDDQQINGFAVVGTAVWFVGFAIEVIADAQLARFLARKRAGQASGLLTAGLWSRSRHPNYFGEAVAWWGISIIALGVPFGWIGLCSAVLVTILVRYVSGVPILEREWRSRPGFSEWATHTPIFLPRFTSPQHGAEQ